MKKFIVLLASAALFCCACSGDTCKCVTTTTIGDSTTKTETSTPKPEDKTCNEVAESLKTQVGDVLKVSVVCKTVKED